MKKVLISALVIILIAAIGISGWYLWDSLEKEKSKTSELESKIAKITEKNDKTSSETIVKKDESEKNKQNENSVSTESKEISKTKTYSDMKGTYESQNININAGTDLEPLNMTYRLILNEDGSFIAYYLAGDTSCHYVGYYTIVDNAVSLHSVVFTGNDPSASLNNKVFEFTLNSDGTIEDKENNKFTRKTTSVNEDTNIANVINSYLDGCTTSGKNGQGPWFSGLSK